MGLQTRLGQQTVDALPFSSRSLKSTGFLKRTFTKSTRSASGGKCPEQLSPCSPLCPFPSKTMAQGAPSGSSLTGRGLLLSAERCLCFGFVERIRGVEWGGEPPREAKATGTVQTIIGKERSGREGDEQGHVSEDPAASPWSTG